jgi:signal transduction histidine kinase
MDGLRINPKIGILFILSILVPSFILGFMAMRAIDMQEAYIEKQFEGTLMAEILHQVTRVHGELAKIEEELDSLFRSGGNDEPGFSLSPIGDESDLVMVPFLVSREKEILLPDKSKTLTQAEDEFLFWNSEFLEDRTSIPVYENIAVAYSEMIMDELARKKVVKSRELNREDIDEKENSSASNTNEEIWEIEIQQQAIINEFEQSEEVRNKVYDRAMKEGQMVLSRNVKRQKEDEEKENKKPDSLYISNDLTFSQIVEGKELGFIPRILEQTLQLLFWKKDPGGFVYGCMLDMDALKKQLVRLVIPSLYTHIRVLTILDENGTPLVTPPVDVIKDWRLPFVSREVSGILPRWEVAAYLTDPHIISEEAGFISLVMWILIFILIITIIVGASVILKSFYSEIILAQQKTTFVSNVSHELKTPLTSIRLFAEMMRENRQKDIKKQQQYLSLMVSETQRLTRLINNVLDFSKMGQGKKQYYREETDIVSLCREIVEGQRLRLEQNGFTLVFSVPDSRIMVFIDKEAIKQVLINLLSNAEKYSDTMKEIEVEVHKAEGAAHMTIKDRGIGIPSGEAKKIFKEFYRVDDTLTSRVRGSGLGLTISKKILHDHDGEVRYFPREGGGSIFEITIPLYHPEGEKNA